LEFSSSKALPAGESERRTLINMSQGTESRAMTMEESQAEAPLVYTKKQNMNSMIKEEPSDRASNVALYKSN
jgi:hypothetical protein